MTAQYPNIVFSGKSLSTHPWIFARSLKGTDGIRNGSIANLVDKDGGFLARGIFNGHARIGLRVLTRDENEAIDASFLERRLLAALEYRRRVVPDYLASGHFRLANSEGDFLSGLIIDVYGDLAVVECFSKGYLAFRQEIESILRQLLPLKDINWFAEKRVQKQESFDLRPGPTQQRRLEEFGLKFDLSTDQMHKTGFYLDQRDNRLALAKLCEGKAVADLCCFAGAFGIAAKVLGKAAKVTAIDLDPDAIALGEENARLNAAEIDFVCANVSDWAMDPANKQQYDVVVLDPPKLTKNSREVDAALRRYTHLNAAALAALKPGGLFVSCSCTGLVSEEALLKSIRRAGQLAKQNLRIWRLTGAAPDHPFSIDSPEGRYLKVVWAFSSPSNT